MRASGQGMDIKLAKSNIRKQVGSGLFSSLIPLAASIAPTIGKTLGLSALSGLASEGESQIVKAISGNGIPYLVTHDKLHHFANNSQKKTTKMRGWGTIRKKNNPFNGVSLLGAIL